MNRKVWELFAPKAFEAYKEQIVPTLKELSKTTKIWPSAANIFKAFIDPKNIKVIILGQDPYHDGSATGLAFDNKAGGKVSPSLRNILKELESDTGKQISLANKSSVLENWPAQGVFLLNTSLTVENSKPNSHQQIWKSFTEELVKAINAKDDVVWVLWGKYAQDYKKFITNPTHKLIESAHPSPFSYERGFKNSKPFSKVNELLKGTNINWHE